MPPRPNIVYIHSHDTGRYVQPYGHPVPTPNIQDLAASGVLFRQAFCAAPTCSPSRAALLTGQSPHSSGMLGLAHRGFALRDYREHIVHTLRHAGYHTALAGVQHVAVDPAVIGYDTLMVDRPVAHELAAKFLHEAPREPFFLDVGFGETHRRFPEPGPDDDPRYMRPPLTLPDTPETRRDTAAYTTMARLLDAKIGHVLDALRDAGRDRNTIVICTTDHGVAFPGNKCNLTDHGIGVMLIIRGPQTIADGTLAGGRVCDAMISQIDLFPTLCELLEIDKPAWLEGRSFLPVLHGKTDEVNDEIFSEITYHAAYDPQRCVRTQRWKYIRRYDGRERVVLGNIDDSPSKTVWLEHGWRERHLPAEAFYDLVFDPMEMNNLAESATHRPVLEEMRSRLEAWMQRTSDPLLHGPVPAPPGSRLNDPESLSPSDPARVM